MFISVVVVPRQLNYDDSDVPNGSSVFSFSIYSHQHVPYTGQGGFHQMLFLRIFFLLLFCFLISPRGPAAMGVQASPLHKRSLQS